MSPKPDEYQVEGYDVVTEGYDAPYHPAKDFDPNVDFEFAGDPEKQVEAQKKRKGKKRPSEFDSPRGEEVKVAKLTTPVPPKRTAENLNKTETSKESERKAEYNKADSPEPAKSAAKKSSSSSSSSSSPAKKTSSGVKKSASSAKKTVKKAVNK